MKDKVEKNTKMGFESKKQYESIFSNMQEGFALHEILCDESGKPYDYKFLDLNSAFERITGLKHKEVIDKTIKSIMPEIDDGWIELYGEVALTGIAKSFTKYSTELSKYFYISVYSPGYKQFVTIFSDITEHKMLETKLREEKAFFQTTLHSLSAGVISTDINCNITSINTAAQVLSGWSLEKVIGNKMDDFIKIIDDSGQKKWSCSTTLANDSLLYMEMKNNLSLIKKNNQKLPIDARVAPIKDEVGCIIGNVLVFMDDTYQRNKQQEAIYLSYHDYLTSLYNRRFFEEELKRLDTERNLPFSIAMIDVNGLKMTNDAFGHLAGDELLKGIATIIKNECRTDDIIARIGGDEFAILFPKTSYVEAGKIVSRIYSSINIQEMNNVVMSVSVGWETKMTKDQLMKDVFIKAEESMYRNKITESQNMRNETIKIIFKKLNEKSHKEKSHAENVSKISKKIGEYMKLESDLIKEIELAGLMHDIGKISINENILNKLGWLTEEEFMEVKRHPENSYQILKSVDAYMGLAESVIAHHEWWDGNGYPRGISGQSIPLIARIIAVADAFDEMMTYKDYIKTITVDDVMKVILHLSGRQFDPTIVDVFVDNFESIIGIAEE